MVQIDRRGGEVVTRPDGDVRLEAGDGVLIVGRGGIAAASSVFDAPARPVRAGRSLF